jgi:hypothetical protein
MKIKILFAIAVTGLLTSGYLLLRNHTLKERYLDQVDLVEKERHDNEALQMLGLRYSSALQSNVFSEKKIIVTDSSGKESELSEITAGKPVVVLRIKENSCDACYQSQFKNLIAIIEKTGRSSAIVLGSFRDLRSFRMVYRNYAFGTLPLFMIDEDAMKQIPFDRYTDPYVFLLNKDLTASYFFLPNKTLEDFNSAYYKMMEEKVSDTSFH